MWEINKFSSKKKGLKQCEALQAILIYFVYFQIVVPYGRKHKNYGVTAAMLDMMSMSFLVAIQPKLEEKAM